MSVETDLFWGSDTVRQEAGGEDDTGQLAVAWVIMNRRAAKQSCPVREVVLAPLQFSCWNGDSRIRQNDTTQWSAQAAFASAYFGNQPDPTHGATHYLRTDLDPKPSWYNANLVTLVHGHHAFLKVP